MAAPNGGSTDGLAGRDWARRLGWTSAFGLLVAGTGDSLFVGATLSPVFFVLAFLAAFATGVHFPSPLMAGPPVAALMLPSSTPPERIALGAATPKEESLIVLLWGGWTGPVLLAGVCCGLARTGVVVGQRCTTDGIDRG